MEALLPHKAELEKHLKERLGELFTLDYDWLLNDVTRLRRKFHFTLRKPFFRFGRHLFEQWAKLFLLGPCVCPLIDRNDETVILC